MAKRKKADKVSEAAPEEGGGTQDSLRSLTFDLPTLDGTGTEAVGVDVEMQETLAAVAALDNILATYIGSVDAEEGVLVHTFYRRLSELAKAGTDQLKPRLTEVAAAEGGKIETPLGELLATEVAASVEQTYSDKTVALLESHGLLPKAVEMQATMQEGVDVESIPASDLETIRKYFDVAMVPSPAKIEGLIALGKLKAKEVQDTMDTREVRKGYTRVEVRPSDDLKAAFGIEP